MVGGVRRVDAVLLAGARRLVVLDDHVVGLDDDCVGTHILTVEDDFVAVDVSDRDAWLGGGHNDFTGICASVQQD